MTEAKEETPVEEEETQTIGERRKALDPVVSESDLSDEEIIARRSADISAKESDVYRKVYILPPGPKPTEANGYDHAANKAATREFAIQSGLYPTGDTKLDSIKQHPNKVSWVLTYSLPVTPAERFEGISDPDVVLQGKDAGTNTGGAGHSGDTSGKTPA